MFERPHTGERAILVHVRFRNAASNQDLREFRELVSSAGAEIVAVVSIYRNLPDAKFLIGSGKVEELGALVRFEDADAVIFNCSLSPSQERNLEKVFCKRVLDRTGLILDIFAQRARSYEGKLQVELAQLKYLSTRLVRGWSHLERQKGGIGLRGPGEKQLESDRRLLGQRIRRISKRLEKLRRQRGQSRAARRKTTTPAVAIVGYTNAGKSTLFNALTNANAYSADKLFATLDTTLRRLEISRGQHVVVTDTVGFIRDLPHDLIKAFHATLQEVQEADLLLHVVDASDDDRDDGIVEVESVLAQIEASSVPRIMVYNKIDQANILPSVKLNQRGDIQQVWLSALRRQGMDLLIRALRQHFDHEAERIWLRIPPSAGNLRSELYSSDGVRQEFVDDQGCWQIEAEVPRQQLARFVRYKISVQPEQQAGFIG